MIYYCTDQRPHRFYLFYKIKMLSKLKPSVFLSANQNACRIDFHLPTYPYMHVTQWSASVYCRKHKMESKGDANNTKQTPKKRKHHKNEVSHRSQQVQVDSTLIGPINHNYNLTAVCIHDIDETLICSQVPGWYQIRKFQTTVPTEWSAGWLIFMCHQWFPCSLHKCWC